MTQQIQDSLAPGHPDLEDTILQLAAVTLGIKLGKINPEAPLFSSQQGFDSFGLTEFVLRLEDTFGLNIPDEDLDPDIFYSVKTIASYLRIRLERRD